LRDYAELTDHAPRFDGLGLRAMMTFNQAINPPGGPR
jgi:hypothetical protein